MLSPNLPAFSLLPPLALTPSGYADVPAGAIDPFKVSVTFIPAPSCADKTPLRLLTKGEPEAYIDEARASVILAEEDLEIDIDLGNGEAEAQFWTCDFSHEYVTINGDVSSSERSGSPGVVARLRLTDSTALKGALGERRCGRG